MERIAKLALVLSLLCTPVFADAPLTPQNVTLPQCVKTFNVEFEKLFLLTEIAISSNNFNIDEIQSQGGYIVFSVSSYKFLATVFTFGEKQAILKITPCNGSYLFPPMIVKNIFKYIETNQYNKF